MNFFKPVTLFNVLGFDVKADSSWIFLSIFIAWTFSTKVFPSLYPGFETTTYMHMGVWSLVGLLVSIIVHELGHAVIAEYYNMPIISIRLFIFGGVAEMEGAPSHPRGEFFMAIAGPIMSFFMAALFWGAYIYWTNVYGAGPEASSFKFLGALNLILALFNIVPAFPLDGGRALRALLWARKRNFVAATRTASLYGEFFAYMLMAYACYQLVQYDSLLSAVWNALIGFYILTAGQYAVKQSETWSLLSEYTTQDFMQTDLISVSPDLELSDFVENFLYKHYQPQFPVVDRKELIGLITVHDVMKVDRKKWSWTHVRTQMIPMTKTHTIAKDAPASDALDKMHRLGVTSLLVLNKGKLEGILNLKEIMNYLSVTRKLDQQKILSKNDI